MANNVYSNFWIYEGNDEVKKWFREKLDGLVIPEDEVVDFELYKPVHEMFWSDVNEEETSTRSWYIDNIGAKWCNVQDIDVESISCCSAWDYPEYFYVKIAEEAEKIDPKVIFAATYEDEMPNFFGSSVFYEGEVYDNYMIESDEYSNEGLSFYWDEDEMGEEEPEDWEPSWEQMCAIQENSIENIIYDLREEQDVETN